MVHHSRYCVIGAPCATPWPLWLIPAVLISPAAFIIPVDVFTQYPWVEAYAWSWLPLCLIVAWFDYQKGGVKAIDAQIKSPQFFVGTLTGCYGLLLLWYAPANLLFSNGLMSRYNLRARLYQSAFAWVWPGPFQTYVTALVGVLAFRCTRALWVIRPHYDIGPQIARLRFRPLAPLKT